MAKQSREWTDILVKRGVVGPDQIQEAQKMGGASVEEALVKLGYASPDEVMKAKAEQFGMDFIALSAIEIPSSVVELVPARMRPYIGGSQDNSFLSVTLGYNGLGRINGNETGSVGGGNGWGETGLTRMFSSQIGGQERTTKFQ